MKKYIAIPARYGSKRFPGKLLKRIDGKPLIRIVAENALLTPEAEVVIATDDQRIAEAVSDLKVKIIMTPPELPSGTDRIAHALKKLQPAEYVINLQGDEPMLTSSLLSLLFENHEKSNCQIFTLARKMRVGEDPSDPNLVKVVVDRKGRALYFSRSPIPFYREEKGEYLIHIGVYSYRWETLMKFVNLPPSPLERAEKLEQLRALENEMCIGVRVVEYDGVGVDTPEDLTKVEEVLKRKHKKDSIKKTKEKQ